MSKYTTYDILETLADKYIPAGRHKYLHVDSSSTWVRVMADVIETCPAKVTVSMLTKYAKNWEAVLVIKLSTLN